MDGSLNLEKSILSVFAFACGIVLTSFVSRVTFWFKSNELIQNFNENQFSLRWRLKGSYFSRLAKLLQQCDPLLIFQSDRKLIKIIKFFENDKNSNYIGDETVLLKKVKQKILLDSAVRPGTTEIIPRPFRMGGYLPFNGPVCIALSMSNTLSWFLFWSWMNQSQAAMVNFFNLPKTFKKSNISSIFVSYTLAVSAALLSSIGIVAFIKKNLILTEEQMNLLMDLLPVPTNGFAALINCFMMNHDILKNGVKILNESKDIYSKAAAKQSLLKTMFIRFLLPIPCFLIPTFIVRISLDDQSQNFKLFFEIFVTTLSFGLGLPVVLAIFPELCEIKRSKTEFEVQRMSENKILIFNRGL